MPLACPYVRTIPPLRYRANLGTLLRSMGLRGAAAELGTREGDFTTTVLSQWRRCALYVQVDAWAPLNNYRDSSNANLPQHSKRRDAARKKLDHEVNSGHARRGEQCANLTSVCALRFADEAFDFIYVDARHDRLGVLQDLSMWWPKLRRGGVMAGHDYMEQHEPRFREQPWVLADNQVVSQTHIVDPKTRGQNWTLNFDGSVDRSGRAVKGAVDDFFGGVALPPYGSPAELMACPRQISVTYRELAWNSWIVIK